MKELGNEYDEYEEHDEIPDVYWKEDIEDIDDAEIRMKEIETANEIMEREKDLNERFKSGKIKEYQVWDEYEFGIRKDKVKAATRSALESVGLTYNDLGSVCEDIDITIREAAGDIHLGEMKKGIEKLIDEKGPDFARQLADDMREEGKLSDEAHGFISQQVRFHGK